ncbi:MAG TPA: DUF2721 domain-containing protein [Vicinamibacterales bacterium]
MADPNPFAALSLIVAPAILTNACSVLVSSTSTRFARAVDRARDLARQLDGAPAGDEGTPRRLREMLAAEERSLLLLRAMRSAYVALSGFASAALISLVGAVLLTLAPRWLSSSLELLGIAAGIIAVASVIHASSLLVRDTRIAVTVLQERAAEIQSRMRR